jgi:hypothetical protein
MAFCNFKFTCSLIWLLMNFTSKKKKRSYLHSNKELSPLDKGSRILVGLGVKLLLYVLLAVYLKARSFNKNYANLIFKAYVCYETQESLIFYPKLFQLANIRKNKKQDPASFPVSTCVIRSVTHSRNIIIKYHV